jgi:hypothetical protein
MVRRQRSAHITKSVTGRLTHSRIDSALNTPVSPQPAGGACAALIPASSTGMLPFLECWFAGHPVSVGRAWSNAGGIGIGAGLNPR